MTTSFEGNFACPDTLRCRRDPPTRLQDASSVVERPMMKDWGASNGRPPEGHSVCKSALGKFLGLSGCVWARLMRTSCPSGRACSLRFIHPDGGRWLTTQALRGVSGESAVPELRKFTPLHADGFVGPPGREHETVDMTDVGTWRQLFKLPQLIKEIRRSKRSNTG